MTPAHKVPFCCCLLAACVLTAGNPKDIEQGLQPPIQIEGQPRVTFRLSDRMVHYHIPAVSVAVIRNGKLDWAQAWGRLEAGDGSTPATVTTRFQAASISKPVAALAALHMAQNGNFSLDEDVNGILKSWKLPGNPAYPEAKITIRRLLSHTAGLTVHGFGGYSADAPVPSLIQVLDGGKPANSAPVRIDIEPGSVHRYSGGGYTVLQQLMIDKSGMAFPDLMEKMVLKRIGMIHSAYSQPLAPGLEKDAARGHRGNGQMIEGRWHTYPELAAAGLWTTPSDLALFLIEIWKASRGESSRIIEKKTAMDMLTIQKGDYALGLGISGAGDGRSFGHGGSNEGFKCNMEMFFNSGDGIVVMTNGDNGGEIASEIGRAAAAAYAWKAHIPPTKKAVEVPVATLNGYAGTYSLGDFQFEVAIESGALVVTPPFGQPPVRFMAESPTTFFPLADGASKLIFNAGGVEVFGRTAKKVK